MAGKPEYSSWLAIVASWQPVGVENHGFGGDGDEALRGYFQILCGGGELHQRCFVVIGEFFGYSVGTAKPGLVPPVLPVASGQ
jgi:hypothetical protein